MRENSLSGGSIREPAVAGQFYPARRNELETVIATHMESSSVARSVRPKGLIAPHAGYLYSGAIAASAYRLIAGPNDIRKVVLLGPSHRVAFRGVATTGASAFLTPFGTTPVDRQTSVELQDTGLASCFDEAHLREHSLEVQLPFLQWTLGEFELVPLVVGDAPSQHVAALLEQLWGGPQTLVVVSSDLSHYLPYAVASELDAETAERISGLKTDIGPEQACGCRCINGLTEIATRLQRTIESLDVRNSGDTAGPKDRVVGYGAFALY